MTMKTPVDKKRADLPPKPKGGGAAGRIMQFQMERGVPANVLFDGADDAETDATRPCVEPKKPKRSKKPKA
jgi:hypothetical protein